jgi:putative hemolysin
MEPTTVSAPFWLFLNFLTIISLAFFSMMEMALVSFNPVRLQYYLSKNDAKAIKIQSLLSNPLRLFGTTLIGVNVSMFIGAECMRQFHETIGLSPDLAPFSQVFIVVLFGELAPMFSARQYAEQVSLLFITPLYFTGLVLRPFIFLISGITNSVLWLIGGKKESVESLSREELLRLIADPENNPHEEGMGDLSKIATNLFNLREATAASVMTPLENMPKLPSHATCKKARDLIRNKRVQLLPVYQKRQENIIGIALARNLINSTHEEEPVTKFCTFPWFVTEHSGVLDLIQQFRKNKQSIAIVLNEKGDATGVIQLRDLLKKIFTFQKEEIEVKKTP